MIRYYIIFIPAWKETGCKRYKNFKIRLFGLPPKSRIGNAFGAPTGRKPVPEANNSRPSAYLGASGRELCGAPFGASDTDS